MPSTYSFDKDSFSRASIEDIKQLSYLLDNEAGSVLYDEESVSREPSSGRSGGEGGSASQISPSSPPAKRTSSSSALDGYNIDWKKQYIGQSYVVLKPRSTEQVSRILQYCYRHRIPTVPQGGNTSLVGGSVPALQELILSMERMNQINGMDAVTGIVYCQAGCILEQLQTACASAGLRISSSGTEKEEQKDNTGTDDDNDDQSSGGGGLLLPIDLGAKGTCQIGGNLSTNAGGQYYYRYGSLAANLVGLQVVWPNEQGQIANLNFAPTTETTATSRTGKVDDGNSQPRSSFHSNLKDNTGYKLSQLMLGSEGTLGVITGVALKCPPLPKSRQAAFLACSSFDQVVQVIALAKQELGEILAALEYMDQAVLQVIQDTLQQSGTAGSSGTGFRRTLQIPVTQNNSSKSSAPYPHCLLLETHGSCEEHDVEKLDRFLTKAMQSSHRDGVAGAALVEDGVLAQDWSQRQEFWRIREMANPAVTALGYGYKYDLSLPVADFAEFAQHIQDHLHQSLSSCDNSTNSVCTNWGHVLDGNLHFNITTPGQFHMNPTLLQCLEPYIFEQILQRGGSISAEHGIGQAKRKLLDRVHDPALLETMRALKHVFNPRSILNPNKFLP